MASCSLKEGQATSLATELGHVLGAWEGRLFGQPLRRHYAVAVCGRCSLSCFAEAIKDDGVNPALEARCLPKPAPAPVPVRLLADPAYTPPDPITPASAMAGRLALLTPINETQAAIELGIHWRQIRGIVLASKGALRYRGNTVVKTEEES